MKLAWGFTIIAGTLAIVTSWFWPAQPFNGLSIVALFLSWMAGAIVLTRGGES